MQLGVWLLFKLKQRLVFIKTKAQVDIWFSFQPWYKTASGFSLQLFHPEFNESDEGLSLPNNYSHSPQTSLFFIMYFSHAAF